MTVPCLWLHLRLRLYWNFYYIYVVNLFNLSGLLFLHYDCIKWPILYYTLSLYQISLYNLRIMKVSGSLFHPDCFTCTVCQKSMVGVPFSLDDDKKIYCAEDYQRKHASICSACSQPILPRAGETSAPRLRAMGRDFHPACFKCQDCSLVLDSRIPGCECYPLGDTPLCGDCNRKRQS